MVMNKIFFVLFGVVCFITMNHTLTKMTVADCNYRIELACEELYK